jgi:hypothetical protein
MLRYCLSPVAGISGPVADRMYQLMETHYANTDRSRFFKDLSAKTGVLLLLDDQKVLRGFSTYLVIDEPKIAGRILFSGDTVTQKEYWGSPALFYGIGGIMAEVMRSCSDNVRPYWFLISKGIRTYGMLPLFFKRFWPSPEPFDAEDLKRKVDILAAKWFGPLYSRGDGIIHARQDFLTGELATTPQHKQNDPFVRFFLERNSGYAMGDELACLCEISLDNIRCAAQRFVTAAGPRE